MTRRIGLLIFPDFQILDVAGPIAAFEIAGRLTPGAYQLVPMAPTPGLVAASSGVAMQAAPMVAERLDTLLISGGEGTRGPAIDQGVLDFVRRASATARRVASVCSGAYVLAEAGLLDGRRATIHWARSAHFARRYPKVKLEADRIFVRDGSIWTSAGITAGIDLALALIGEDLGEDVARRTAQQLVVYHRRPGGQSQFSALIEMGGQGGRFAELLDWMRERLAEPLPVERLADKAAMSPRHFARAFTAETGLTPAKAVERLRLETARERVEGSAEPIDRIAQSAGFGDPERMRRAFIRAFGQPPQALRRTARGELGAAA
ncbi:MAG: GlxA family transcriptional regulator [Phenylobacterium sp.]|uniref:GlxA family transcriptional regulator n=1 Tax=Phenylobacterium sp. TaxID=1871053 RepID=UPI003919E23A